MSGPAYFGGFLAGLFITVCLSGIWLIVFKLISKIKNLPKATYFGTIALACLGSLGFLLMALGGKGQKAQSELMTAAFLGAAAGAAWMIKRSLSAYQKVRQDSVAPRTENL
jgi:hypothetical protein